MYLGVRLGYFMKQFQYAEPKLKFHIYVWVSRVRHGYLGQSEEFGQQSMIEVRVWWYQSYLYGIRAGLSWAVLGWATYLVNHNRWLVSRHADHSQTMSPKLVIKWDALPAVPVGRTCGSRMVPCQTRKNVTVARPWPTAVVGGPGHAWQRVMSFHAMSRPSPCPCLVLTANFWQLCS